jgi:hypothetical protein
MQSAAVAQIAVGEPDPSNEKPQGPYTGDTKITVDHLRSLGWSHDKVQQILGGPESTSLAALVGKETKGFRARGVEGARVVLVEGTAIPNCGGAHDCAGRWASSANGGGRARTRGRELTVNVQQDAQLQQNRQKGGGRRRCDIGGP